MTPMRAQQEGHAYLASDFEKVIIGKVADKLALQTVKTFDTLKTCSICGNAADVPDAICHHLSMHRHHDSFYDEYLNY